MRFVRFLAVIVALTLSIAVPTALAGGLDGWEAPKKPIILKDDRPKVDPSLTGQGGEFVEVIIKTKSGSPDAPGIRDVKSFVRGNVHYAKVPVASLGALERNPLVESVNPNSEVFLSLDVSAPLVEVERFWNAGYNGTGVSVCIIDSGINSTHPALEGRVINGIDLVTNDNDGNTTDDFSGHGTFIAGIIASADSFTRGMALNASLLNAKAFSSTTGVATVSSVMEAMDWCVNRSAHVISMSLSGLSEANDGSDPLSSYSDDVVDLGKVVVISAGNSGPTGSQPSCRTSRDNTGSSYSICMPGLAHKAITVGSVGSGKSSTTGVVSGFSSRGPTADNRSKPDIVAPGSVINSTNATNGYDQGQGTSYAAPHVSGIAALMLQYRPNMTSSEIKTVIMNSPRGFENGNYNNSYGAGRINASRIFEEIDSFSNGTILPDSNRTHEIEVLTGNEIRATLYWPENYSVHNDLDLYLYFPNGTLANSSILSGDTSESVYIESAEVPGNWTLEIEPYSMQTSEQGYILASNAAPSAQTNVTKNVTVQVNQSLSLSDNASLNRLFHIESVQKLSTADSSIWGRHYEVQANLSVSVGGISDDTYEDLPAPEPEESSSGSGGGGGGSTTTQQLETTSASEDETKTDTVHEVSIANIPAGGKGTLTVTNNDASVTSVQVTVNKESVNVGISVRDIDDYSGTSPDGNVISYVEINKTNLDDSDIDSVNIRFKVDNAELRNNKDRDISLFRYTGTWTMLDTKMLSSDSTYTYFDATSPGFSIFAIVATVPTNETVVQENVEAESVQTFDSAPIVEFFAQWYWVAIAAGAVVAGYFLVYPYVKQTMVNRIPDNSRRMSFDDLYEKYKNSHDTKKKHETLDDIVKRNKNRGYNE